MSRKRPEPLDQLNVVQLILIEHYVNAVDLIQRGRNYWRTWPFVERRRLKVHWVGERRNAWWWPFEAPTQQRTPFVIFASLLGMTAVLISGLAAASAGHFEVLWMIPAYAALLVFVLERRQRVLNALTA